MFAARRRSIPHRNTCRRGQQIGIHNIIGSQLHRHTKQQKLDCTEEVKKKRVLCGFVLIYLLQRSQYPAVSKKEATELP